MRFPRPVLGALLGLAFLAVSTMPAPAGGPCTPDGLSAIAASSALASTSAFGDDGTLAWRDRPAWAGDRGGSGEPLPVEFTPSVRVDDDLSPEHREPVVAWGPAGEIYAAYCERATHYNPELVMFTRSTDAGDTWLTPAVRMNDTQPNAAMFPAIEVLPDGTILLAWCEMKFSPFNNEIRFARSNDGGLTWSPSVVVHPINPSMDYYRPCILAVQGRILIAFWQEVTYPNGIPVLVYSDDGGESWVGPSPMTSMLGPYDGSAPCLAYNDRTAVLGLAMPANGERVVFSHSDDLGLTWTVPVQVNDAIATSTDYPDLACAAGYFYVTWNDNRYGQFNADIFFSRSATGTGWTANVKVNDAFEGNQYEPHIRADEHERVHICWIWNMPFQMNIDLYYSTSTDCGTTWLPTSVRVNDLPYTVQPYVSWTSDILCNQQGDVFIAWNDGRASSSYDNVYCSRSMGWSAVGDPSHGPDLTGAGAAALGGAILRVGAQPGPRPYLSLHLPRAGSDLRLSLYEISGRLVGSARLGALPAGEHAVALDGLLARSRTGSGRYVAVVTDGRSRASRGFVLVRPQP